MTRINSGINPKNLTDEHLLAEHREIKRLPNHYGKYWIGKVIPGIPKEICLGKGHVLFFLDKPRFTYLRYLQIKDECILRGFSITNYSDCWEKYCGSIYNTDQYEATDKDRILLEQRITEKILQSPLMKFHYHKKEITKEEAIKLLIDGKY